MSFYWIMMANDECDSHCDTATRWGLEGGDLNFCKCRRKLLFFYDNR